MSLITVDEAIRGALLVVGGGAAGMFTLAAPGSALWLIPAALTAGGMALTVPEVREEVLPLLSDATRQARALLPDRKPDRAAQAAPAASAGAEQRRSSPRPAAARQADRQADQGRPVQAEAAPLPPAAWSRILNENPDQAPHALIVGPSGAGKTTFTAAVLGARPGAAVVLSPKVNPGNWRGAELVTLDDEGDYGPIAEALADLEAEKRRRIRLLRTAGADALAPLTVVLDELPELLRFVPETGPFVVSLSSIGRELKMRLVAITTRADALGVKGWRASEGNFVRVDLDRSRTAVLHDGISPEPLPLDLGPVKATAQAARLRPWRAPSAAAPAAERTPTPAPADLLADLLAAPVESVTTASGRAGNAFDEQGVTVTVTGAAGNGNGHAASVTAASGRAGNAPVVNVYARAVSAPAPAPGGRRRPRGSRFDARRRRLAAEAARQRADLTRMYAEARTSGKYPSFRQAYAALGGNRAEALAAWQAAGGRGEEGTHRA
jgi:hypothetical protein